MKFVPKEEPRLNIFYNIPAALSIGNFRKTRHFLSLAKNIVTLPKTFRENIYKTPMGNLKKTIDFDEKVCYYIFKEREKPKSSREVGTVALPNLRREFRPMER